MMWASRLGRIFIKNQRIWHTPHLAMRCSVSSPRYVLNTAVRSHAAERLCSRTLLRSMLADRVTPKVSILNTVNSLLLLLSSEEFLSCLCGPDGSVFLNLLGQLKASGLATWSSVRSTNAAEMLSQTRIKDECLRACEV